MYNLNTTIRMCIGPWIEQHQVVGFRQSEETYEILYVNRRCSLQLQICKKLQAIQGLLLTQACILKSCTWIQWSYLK